MTVCEKTTAGSNISIWVKFLNRCLHQKIKWDHTRFQTVITPLVLPPAATDWPNSNGKLMHPTAHENNSLDGPSEQRMVSSQLRGGDYFCLSRSVRYRREMSVLSVYVNESGGIVNALARRASPGRPSLRQCHRL